MGFVGEGCRNPQKWRAPAPLAINTEIAPLDAELGQVKDSAPGAYAGPKAESLALEAL